MPCYPMNRGGNYGDYYRGDYYSGDYYQGDPGIFQALAKGIKGIAGVAAKVAKVTPAGQALSLIPKFKPTVMQLPPIPVPRETPGAFPIPGQALERFLPFGASGYGLQVCGVKGQRLNKSTYITRGGGTSRWPKTIIVHPKGTECVKTRRLNVANVRALRRGLRRAQGFAKIARRVMVATARFKRPKRKK